MEGTRLSSFEMPDHWIPFYGVGMQFVRETRKRFFYQDGKHQRRTSNIRHTGKTKKH